MQSTPWDDVRNMHNIVIIMFNSFKFAWLWYTHKHCRSETSMQIQDDEIGWEKVVGEQVGVGGGGGKLHGRQTGK